MSDVLMKRGKLDIDIHKMRMLCDNEDRSPSDAVQTEEHQRLPTNHQKLEERMKQILSSSPQME